MVYMLAPFIYFACIYYITICGWGLFKDDVNDYEIEYIFLDLVNITQSNNPHYIGNYFHMHALAAEDGNIDASNDKLLLDFQHKQFTADRLYGTFYDFDEVLEQIVTSGGGGKYDKQRMLVVVYHTENFNLNLILNVHNNDNNEHNKHVKWIDINDIYGHFYDINKNLTNPRYLYHAKEMFQELKQNEANIDAVILYW